MKTLAKKEERLAFLQLYSWQQEYDAKLLPPEIWSLNDLHAKLNITTAIDIQRNYNAANILVNKLGWEVRKGCESLYTRGNKYVRDPYCGSPIPYVSSPRWCYPIPALRRLRLKDFPRRNNIQWYFEEAIEVPTIALPSRNGMLSMWCVYCDTFHHHGDGVGHRVEHCSYDTPYKKHGYILDTNKEQLNFYKCVRDS